MLDLIVKNGTVIDGTGRAGFLADVAVRDGRIVDIAALAHATAATELDATGLVVTPGFIDIHSHSDFTLLVDPRAHTRSLRASPPSWSATAGTDAPPSLTSKRPRAISTGMSGRLP